MVKTFIDFYKLDPANSTDVIMKIKCPTVKGLHVNISENGYSEADCLILFSTKVEDVIESIVHECTHMTTETFEYVSMNHNKQTDEAYAYLLGFYVRTVIEGINKLNKKDKKNGNVRKTGPKQVPKRNNNNKG